MRVKIGDKTTFLKEMHSRLVHVNVLQFLIVKPLVQRINHGHEVAIQSLASFCESHSVDDILQLAVLQCHFSFCFVQCQASTLNKINCCNETKLFSHRSGSPYVSKVMSTFLPAFLPDKWKSLDIG
jgi:hypothetical protein